MLRKLSRAVAAILAGVVLAALGTEAFFRIIDATPLRWVLPLPQVALYGPDFATGYRHRSDVTGMWLTEHRNFIRTSNLGLRDRDRPFGHGAGPRTVIVGNSIIEAVQVRERQTGPAVAENILTHELPGAEVVDLGLSGARPAVDVARLQSQGLALTPDLAIVVLDVEDFTTAATIDDREFTGYRPDANGVFHLSYGFRNSSGYRFRTSQPGRVFYWLLDHSEVVRIIDARQNVGIFAEISPPAAAEGGSPRCSAANIEPYAALSSRVSPRTCAACSMPSFATSPPSNAIKNFPSSWQRKPSRQGARPLPTSVPRSSARSVLKSRARPAILDLDGRLAAAAGADYAAELYGFGANAGFGHLNVAGNRVYGEIFADVIAHALASPTPARSVSEGASSGNGRPRTARCTRRRNRLHNRPGARPCARKSRPSSRRSSSPPARGIFDVDKARARLAELNRQAEDPNLWNDPPRASRVMQERTALDEQLTALARIEQELDDQLP